MDVVNVETENADSFSVSYASQLIKRRHFSTSFVWKIARVGSRYERKGDKIISPLFQCSSASWQLAYFPRGDPSNDHFLNIICSSSTTNFNFLACIKFVVLDEDGNNLCELTDRKYTFSSIYPNQRINLFCLSFKPLPNYNTNSLMFNFSICVDEDSIPDFPFKETTNENKDQKPSKKPSLLGCESNSLSSDFEGLYDNGQFSDVTLKLDREEFKAHKLVLSARSKVFAAMFEHDMKESGQDTVDLMQMEVETVRDMLRYVYCGKIRDLSPEEALNLYVAADRYDLQELRTFCRQVILFDISVNNVCDVAEVADLHDDELLIKELKSFLSINGKEIIKTDKWKTICSKNPVLCGKMFEWVFSE